jgi:3-oxoacyl-[acyl-carrier protein] reductase
MDLGLKGKRAILVGATSGIGRATAEIFADEGCNVAVCARTKANVDETVNLLKAKGVTAIGEALDVTDQAAYAAWIASSAGTLGGCDIFICFTSAAGGPPSEDAWRKNFELDLMATYHGIDAARPFLQKSDCASIVVISTSVAIEPSFGPQPYAAIKAAVTNYAAALAQSLAKRKIRVNIVSPGPVFFAGGAWDQIKTGMPDFYEATIGKVAAGRLGEGAEVGRAIVFLASPACRFITGANLVIDGGMTKRVQH